MVQQMAKLVKNGLDLAMSQQRRAILGGRREVAADQAQMWILMLLFPAIGVRFTDDQGVHPGASAFVFARKPIGVKSAHQIVAG
jgi:hypothetical protein